MFIIFPTWPPFSEVRSSTQIFQILRWLTWSLLRLRNKTLEMKMEPSMMCVRVFVCVGVCVWVWVCVNVIQPELCWENID